MTPRLKICGITDATFAAEAAKRGVDYVGVVFAAASPRRVSVGTARSIAASARAASGRRQPPKVVGVFVGGTVDSISKVAKSVPLDVVQLHGGQSHGASAALKDAGFEVWQLADGSDMDDAADAVLLDGRDGGRTGGTGRLADWTYVEEFKRLGRRVVLAGGISADNVLAAASTGADVLDVNSSIETSPGVKSLEKLEEMLFAFARISEADVPELDSSAF